MEVGRFYIQDMRSKKELIARFNVSRKTFNRVYLPTVLAETGITLEAWKAVHNSYFSLDQQAALLKFWEKWGETITEAGNPTTRPQP